MRDNDVDFQDFICILAIIDRRNGGESENVLLCNHKIPSRAANFLAKLYYTSFWDKFGMNINYFGMHPKTKKKVWDGSQVKSLPKPPTQPTPRDFFDISLIPNQIEKLASI